MDSYIMRGLGRVQEIGLVPIREKVSTEVPAETAVQEAFEVLFGRLKLVWITSDDWCIKAEVAQFKMKYAMDGAGLMTLTFGDGEAMTTIGYFSDENVAKRSAQQDFMERMFRVFITGTHNHLCRLDTL